MCYWSLLRLSQQNECQTVKIKQCVTSFSQLIVRLHRKLSNHQMMIHSGKLYIMELQALAFNLKKKKKLKVALTTTCMIFLPLFVLFSQS